MKPFLSSVRASVLHVCVSNQPSNPHRFPSTASLFSIEREAETAKMSKVVIPPTLLLLLLPASLHILTGRGVTSASERSLLFSPPPPFFSPARFRASSWDLRRGKLLKGLLLSLGEIGPSILIPKLLSLSVCQSLFCIGVAASLFDLWTGLHNATSYTS